MLVLLIVRIHKLAVQMGSATLINLQSFMKVGSAIQKLKRVG
jgi:hypothetical protein